MGIYELVAFFRTSPPFRNEGSLASGVILALMGIVIIVLSVGDSENQIAMMGIFTSGARLFPRYTAGFWNSFPTAGSDSWTPRIPAG